jgi:hypothetical protein
MPLYRGSNNTQTGLWKLKNRIPQLPTKTFKMSDHGYTEELYTVCYTTNEEHVLHGERRDFADMNFDNSIHMTDTHTCNRYKRIQAQKRNETTSMAPK